MIVIGRLSKTVQFKKRKKERKYLKTKYPSKISQNFKTKGHNNQGTQITPFRANVVATFSSGSRPYLHFLGYHKLR